MKESDIIALGSALYPIGRLLWRAGRGPPGKAGKEFLESIGREELKAIAPFQLILDSWDLFKKEAPNEEYIEMGRAILEAVDILGKCNETNPTEPLVSVFTLIDIGAGKVEELYYKPVELDLGKELPVPGEKEDITPETYQDLLERLKYYLQHEEFTIETSRVLGLIERLLSFVPACTSEPVVSFYDYSKLLSALTVAIYRANKRGNREKPFLFVEGDVSGIQRFIFRITSKGALKMLRARSVYLDMLSWDIIIEIISKLGLPRSCILHNGGGSFTLILPNTPESIEVLKTVREKLEKFLLKRFEGQLYVALEWDEVSIDEMKTFRDGHLWADLKAKIGERKARRFIGIIDEFVDKNGYEKKAECAVCRRQLTEDEAKRFTVVDTEGEELVMCQTCYELWHLGMALPKGGIHKDGENFAFVRVTKEKKPPITPVHTNSIELPFSRVYWLGSVESIDDRTIPMGSQVLLRNSLDLWKVPKGYDAYPYVVADYAKLVKENGKLTVIDFKKLAENAVGAKKVGVFKADVDNLGLIFSRGLTNKNPALIAGLSRLMDYFFKSYLKSLIEGNVESSTVPKDVPRLPSSSKNGANIVVIYAGGDDLFIVGSWNEVFNLAFLVRETFRVYSGNNPNITLSAGIATFNPNFPVARMAQVAEERLERAKDEGKNRIFLLDRTTPREYHGNVTFPMTFGWDEYLNLWKKYGERFRINGEGIKVKGSNGEDRAVPKSQLWKLLEIREVYTKNPKGIRWNYLLAYYIARSNLEDVFGDLIAIDVGLLQEGRPQIIYWIDGILKPVLFAVRG